MKKKGNNAKYQKPSNLTSRISKRKDIRKEEGMRLNQFIAKAGICSRREADQFISAGLVSVNDKLVVEMGYKVKKSDVVKFNNSIIKGERKKYLLLNKPKGFICSSEKSKNQKTVTSLIQNACKEQLYPIGRLQRQTTGLLLFTNDPDISAKLTSSRKHTKKIYHVVLDKNLKGIDLNKIIEGIEIEGQKIVIKNISYVKNATKKEIGIEIILNKNNIIRPIFEKLGYRIIKLDRVYFCGLTKKDLPKGRSRFLTEQEVGMLKMI